MNSKQRLLNYFPLIGRVSKRVDELGCECADIKKRVNALENRSEQKAEQDPALYVPPGHFYSPIPSLEYLQKHRDRIFKPLPKDIPGVDLNEEAQIDLLNHLKKYYDDQPFSAKKTEGMRYFFDNPAYSYLDGIFLHSMIRYSEPKRIIEVGSGYSTCVMLDTNDLYFNCEIDITCIEPYPELLLSLMSEKDKRKTSLIKKDLQEVDLNLFKRLGENDILFIDSTHVSKIDSDVNYIFFEILPILRPGVIIHFHDVFYPFEYPMDWIMENRAWNEVYMLRAFLQFNNSFRVLLFSSYLMNFFADHLKNNMPLCFNNAGGNIWLQRK